MQPITNDLSSILEMSQLAAQQINFTPKVLAGEISQEVLDDIAAYTPDLSGMGNSFDIAMDNMAFYKDMLSTAQSGISQMESKGMDIKDLILKAQQGGVSTELLDKLQMELDSKLLDINIIKETAENGINGSNGRYSVSVPDIKSLMGLESDEAVEGEMSDMMKSLGFDINLNIDGMTFGGSAKLSIGMGQDGSLQFAVDTNIDYDLSGLMGDGITSEDAMSIIENYVQAMHEQGGALGQANNIIDAIFERIYNAVNNNEDDVQDSAYLKGQIIQKSALTLNSSANIAPNIAINLL